MIHIRFALYTDYGPVGPRLERGQPLPEGPTSFPMTEEGKEQAFAQLAKYQAYWERHHKQPAKLTRRKS
jgi:hypothetical protein